MLTALAIVATLAAAGLTGRWSMRRYDALGRPRGFPTISVALLLVLATASAVPVVRHRLLERRLSSVASTLVGIAVTVHCQTAGQQMIDTGSELGWVRFDATGAPEHSTLVKREPCAALSAYLHGDGRSTPSPDTVIAVHVLTHEAEHMAGLTGESSAECAAVQRDATTARLLGATQQQAAALAAAYWSEVYPGMPDDYRSGECRAGGAMDERLPGAPWASPDAISGVRIPDQG